MIGAFVKRVFLSPQLWLAAAALSVAGSFVVDYIDAQRTADRALALRQGPPPASLLQDFDSAVNVGPAKEVLIRAETDLGDPVIVTLGPEGAAQTAVIYPLFPVSDIGRAAIRTREEGEGGLESIRPVPRPTGDVEMPQALGVMLHWTDGSQAGDIDIEALIGQRFGGGRFGSVIEVNGERVAPGDMALVVKGAMAAQDLSITGDFLAVAPFEDGREVALSPPPSSGLQRGLFWGGVTLALGGIVMSVRLVDLGPERPQSPKRPGHQDTRVSTGSTAKARSRFQTIPTQDEIYAAAQIRKAREAEARKKSGLIDTARSGVQRIRTRH